MTDVTIKLAGQEVVITVNGSAGVIASELKRETCPYCGSANCNYDCDESCEGNDDPLARLQYNTGLDIIESILLAHACAGLDITQANYLNGLEVALAALMQHLC